MKHLTHCVLLTKTNNKRRIKISSKPHVLAEKLKYSNLHNILPIYCKNSPNSSRMRLFFALMGNGRWPQKIDKVPFRALLPLKLRNRVSGKSDRQKLAPCIQELTALFAKMKEHEFDEQLCAKEIETLRKANRDYLTSR